MVLMLVTTSGLTAKAGNTSVDDFNLVTGGAWGQNASGVTFNVEGNRSYDLTGGKIILELVVIL